MTTGRKKFAIVKKPDVKRKASTGVRADRTAAPVIRIVPLEAARNTATSVLLGTSDPRISALVETDVRNAWRRKTLDDVDYWMQRDEDFRRIVSRLVRHHGKQRRGSAGGKVWQAMMLLSDFDIADKHLRLNRGPMYRPTNADKARYLVATALYRGITPETLLKRLDRIPAALKRSMLDTNSDYCPKA